MNHRRLALAAALLATSAVALAVFIARTAAPSIPAGEPVRVIFAHTTGDGVSAMSDADVFALMSGTNMPSGAPTTTPGPVTAPSLDAGVADGGGGWLIVGSACTPDPGGSAARLCYGVARLAESLPDRDLYLLNVTTGIGGDAAGWAAVRVEPQMSASSFTAWPGGVIDGPCAVSSVPPFGDVSHCGRAEGIPVTGGGWQVNWQCSRECADAMNGAGVGAPANLVYVVSVAEGTAPDWRILAAHGS
jgi:hypothetical protein